ncbi:hypothetical protein ACVIHH_008183 [Bradyrhizobium sp. USDA 4518]|uniref:hypothetical protein n=1 Tax=unclassified Bradyrhizobium TaxID=2631580 RepID=UPI0020A0B8EB|nr:MULTISPECIES: hypothetical protein [unclassified Bradyrhizobium]MCP1835728.1 hypothetical protein [Bradyrhizobium sp. USDA 4545]MCP1920477.1 hypothetical protein [Bradyrhizobium sp. USDA 4532]
MQLVAITRSTMRTRDALEQSAPAVDQTLAVRIRGDNLTAAPQYQRKAPPVEVT